VTSGDRRVMPAVLDVQGAAGPRASPGISQLIVAGVPDQPFLSRYELGRKCVEL